MAILGLGIGFGVLLSVIVFAVLRKRGYTIVNLSEKKSEKLNGSQHSDSLDKLSAIAGYLLADLFSVVILS